MDVNFIEKDNNSVEKMYEVKLNGGKNFFVTATSKEDAKNKANEQLQEQGNEEVVGEGVNLVNALTKDELSENMSNLMTIHQAILKNEDEFDQKKLDDVKKLLTSLALTLQFEDKETGNVVEFKNGDELWNNYWNGEDNLREDVDNGFYNIITKPSYAQYVNILNQYYNKVIEMLGDKVIVGTTGGLDVEIDAGYVQSEGIARVGDAGKYVEEGAELGDTKTDAKSIESVDERISSVAVLRNIIASWYVTLRTVALVGLLTVLVYIGIRILLSAAAEDKAKYKKLLKDWIVGLCLVFVLHYIMSFTLKVTTKLTEIFNNNSAETILCELPKNIKADIKMSGNMEQLEPGVIYGVPEGTNVSEEDELQDKSRPYYMTNFMGFLRLGVNWYDLDGKQAFASLLMYTVMVIYTVIFSFKYLKRVFIMAFLTLIAPLVALTYPIDKVKDGSAQAFNFWLREYIFNALIQVIHLLIYTIVVSSVYELSVQHPIYAIIALGTMIPVENLVRKMFGFEKAGTVSTLASAAGAGILMNGIQKFTRGIGKGSPKHQSKNNIAKEKMPNIWTNTTNKTDLDDMILGEIGGDSSKMNLRSEAKGNLLNSSSSQRIANQGGNNSSVNNSSMSRSMNNLFSNEIPGNNSRLNMNLDNKGVKGMSGIKGNYPNNRKISLSKRYKDGFKAMGSQFYTRNLQGRRPIHSLAKLGARGVGAVLGAGIGLAAGVASGDVSKAATFAVGGGAALGGLSGNLFDKTDGVFNDYSDTFNSAFHYDDDSYLSKKRIEEFKSNGVNMEELRSKYNADEIKKIEKDILPAVVGEHGIKDVSDIAAIADMTMKDGMDLDKSIAIAEASNKIGSLSTAKARKEAMDTFKENYSEKLGVPQIRKQTQMNLDNLSEIKNPGENATEAQKAKYKSDLNKREKEKLKITSVLKEKEKIVEQLAKQQTDVIRSYQKRKK